MERRGLDDVLYVAEALLADGSWRPWMLPSLLHLQRGHVVELLRRLGPLVTAALRAEAERAAAAAVVFSAGAGAATVNEPVRRRRVSVSEPCSPFEPTS